jgi:hypothetical protein
MAYSPQSGLVEAGAPISGRVLRIARLKKKPREIVERFSLLLGENDLPERFNPWKPGESEVVHAVPFVVEGSWIFAPLMTRVVPPGAIVPVFQQTRTTVPEEPRTILVDSGEAIAFSEVWATIAQMGKEPLELGAESAARVVADNLSESEIAGFWAAIELLKRSLISDSASKVADVSPGTDSFEYWSLAVIYQGESSYNQARTGRPPHADDPETELAEFFAMVPELAMEIRTGEQVSFISRDRPITLPTTPIKNTGEDSALVEIERDSFELVGMYFDVWIHPTQVHLEVVAMKRVGGEIKNVVAAAIDAAREYASSLGGLVGDNLVISDVGTRKLFSGLSVVDVRRPWQGTLSSYVSTVVREQPE